MRDWIAEDASGRSSGESGARASGETSAPRVRRPVLSLRVVLLVIVAMAASLATDCACGAASGAAADPAAPALQPAWRSSDAWLRVAGRLHPMLVHFPIALILLAAFIEVFRAAIRRTPSRTAVTMLGLGVLGSAASIATGWLNGAFESRSSHGSTLELHRWFAIAGGIVALLAVLFGAVALRSTRPGRSTVVFRGTLLVAAGVTGFAAHLGGSMVYGAGYLFAPISMTKVTPRVRAAVAPEPGRSAQDVGTVDATQSVPGSAELARRESTRLFDSEVLPIFETHCVECHGTGRARASLRLGSLEHVLRAEPWVLAFDDPATSDLVARVKRTADEDGAMPPKGPRLTATEIATIERWIASHIAAERAGEAGVPTTGAQPPDPSVQSPASADASVAAALDAPADAPAHAPADGVAGWTLEQLDAIAFLRAGGASIEPISAGSTLLDVNLALMSPPCDPAALEHLSPLLPLTQRLDLAGADLGNEFATLLTRGDAAPLPLRSLDLDRTRLDDRSARALASLPVLETLIVTHTRLSDNGLAALARSRSLRTIYAAGSKVTETGAASLGGVPSVVLGAPARPTVVHLVRHAEKQEEGDDPSLTEAGAARAAALVGELAGEPIRAIYVTSFARTRETAEPIAKVLRITPTVIEAGRDLDAHVSRVIDAIRGLPRGSTVLVVGHSNTVPAIMRALGVADAIEIDETAYGDLFSVRIENGSATVTRRGTFGEKRRAPG